MSILTREYYSGLISGLTIDSGHDVRDKLLTHDQSMRARIAELEAAVGRSE